MSNASRQEHLGRDSIGAYYFRDMLNAGALTFKEFAMREPLPLATIHAAVLEFLRGRERCGCVWRPGRKRLRRRTAHEPGHRSHLDARDRAR